MNTRPDGGPAYPSNVKADWRMVKHLRDSAQVSMQEAADALGHHPGMTLRDYFAGQALAGYMAHPGEYESPREAARYCYEWADAMLAARAQGGQS